jgi:hypothetical protein
MTLAASSVPCLICGTPLILRLARGRKSGKPFLMLICPIDGRHFRGFITHRDYVAGVLARLEGQPPSPESGVGLDHADAPDRRSRTNLERASDQRKSPFTQESLPPIRIRILRVN